MIIVFCLTADLSAPGEGRVPRLARDNFVAGNLMAVVDRYRVARSAVNSTRLATPELTRTGEIKVAQATAFHEITVRSPHTHTAYSAAD
jgi:hypothetical protein